MFYSGIKSLRRTKMAKEEIKAVGEILGNKTKFKRVRNIIIIICITLIIIAVAGFYFGAINVSF